MASKINHGGYRYCPTCDRIRETRVLAGGYRQVPEGDIFVKRRVVICGTDQNGSNDGNRLFSRPPLERFRHRRPMP